MYRKTHRFLEFKMSNRELLYTTFIGLRRSLAKAAASIVPPKEIEDIVQETYVRICEVPEHQSIQHPKSFIYRIARNLALDHLKRSENRLTVSLDLEDENDVSDLLGVSEDDTFKQAAAKEEFELFCNAVRQLPQQCRRVFVLKKVYGYSQEEIAKELKLSESTVEKHIAFGIKRCGYFISIHGSSPNHQPSRKKEESL